ncbi:DUF1007 family protein [Microvirga flavescens]|uniref:DUF1007 family protein n=1 Tax=Microvirga flavescens TaxID=2249811 RepID=UPI000DD72E0D|nr:DUF1007 family protein [Microvirga flavescens]
MNRRLGLKTALAAAFSAAALPALAHPHVWVTAKADVVFVDGKATGIRHSWAFDEGYSAYVTQGLDKNNDGKLTPDELQDLAKENTESLVDFDYFTVMKANGKKQAFDAPQNPGMAFEDGKVVLSFFLPLKSPIPGGGAVSVDINDPSFFVFFELAKANDAIKMVGAPQGCSITVTRAKGLDMADQQALTEGMFSNSANANFGAQYSNKAILACP